MKEQMTFKPNDRIQIVTPSTILRHRRKTKEIDCILKYMFQYCGQQGTILSIYCMQYPMHATALVRIDNCNVSYLWPIWALKKVKV